MNRRNAALGWGAAFGSSIAFWALVIATIVGAGK